MSTYSHLSMVHQIENMFVHKLHTKEHTQSKVKKLKVFVCKKFKFKYLSVSFYNH